MKYFFTILLLVIPITLFSQLKINEVEFGIYQNNEFSLKSFNAHNLWVSINDSMVLIADGKASKLRRVSKLLSTSSINYNRNTEVAIDENGRKCLVTFVIDPIHSNNKIILYYPFFITIYHIILFVT